MSAAGLQSISFSVADLNRRLQILLSEEQFAFLKELSSKTKRPVGDLVRMAVEKVYRPSTDIQKIRIIESFRDRAVTEEESMAEIKNKMAELKF